MLIAAYRWRVNHRAIVYGLACTENQVKTVQRKVLRHAIPHDYITIDARKMQEEFERKIDKILTICMGGRNERKIDKNLTICMEQGNEREIDKSLTICMDRVNGERVLAEANFAHVSENGEALRLHHFSGFSFTVNRSFEETCANVSTITIRA